MGCAVSSANAVVSARIEDKTKAYIVQDDAKSSKSSSSNRRFKPFLDFPTPYLLRKAQRQYTVCGFKHEKVMANGTIPAPFPPPTPKMDVFEKHKFKHVDKKAKEVPEEIQLRPLKEVVSYLIEDADCDIAKVRAFFVWIACTDTGNDQLPSQCALQMLKTSRAYLKLNELFQLMCRFGEIPCLSVHGKVKDSTYVPGDPIDSFINWCLVYVDECWRIIDQLWGSCFASTTESDWQVVATNTDSPDQGDNTERKSASCTYDMDENYFLTDPEQFIYDHFSMTPQLQLLARPVSEQEFEEMAWIQPSFFNFGVVNLSEPRGKIVTETGDVKLKFFLRPESSLLFNYTLFRHTRKSAIKEDLNKYVVMENKGNVKVIHLYFKHIGFYKMEILVTDLSRDDCYQHELCQYTIQCNCPCFDFEPNPSLPDIRQELGPGAEWKPLKIKASQEGGIINAKHGYAKLEIVQGNARTIDYKFSMKSKNNEINTVNYLLQERCETKTILYLKLPEHGKYLLQVSTKNESEDFSNTCNYLVKSDEKYTSDFFPTVISSRIGLMHNSCRLRPISFPYSYLDAEPEENLDIEMQMLAKCDVKMKLMHCVDQDIAEDVSEYVYFYLSADKIHTKLRFKMAGLYVLHMYTRETNENFVESWRYLIDVKTPSIDCMPFPTFTKFWNPHFQLVSPLKKFLLRDTDEVFDVAVPNSGAVYLDTPYGRHDLEVKSRHCHSDVLSVPDEPGSISLHAEFAGALRKELVIYKLINQAKMNAIRDQWEQMAELAHQRSRLFSRELKKETSRAKDRKKKANAKATRKREEFLSNKAELLELEAKLEAKAREARLRKHMSKRVMKVSTGLFLELKGYNQPNPEVHRVISAVLLLLGEDEKITADWKNCQRLIKTSGQQSFHRRMNQLDPSKVSQRTVARVKQLLDETELFKVQVQSAGAAALFQWAKDCTDLIETSGYKTPRSSKSRSAKSARKKSARY